MRLTHCRWVVLATLCWSVSACHSDDHGVAVPERTASRIAILSGADQEAEPTDELPSPIQLQVLDASGHPMAGVTVTLTVPIGGGSVPQQSAVSDSLGMISTRWTTGSLPGVQVLEARVAGTLLASVTATTCDPDSCYPFEKLSGAMSETQLLTLATYDGSGQAVHPDVVRAHGAATGFWMAITPYPGGNSSYENPSIYYSHDAKEWKAPAGVVNPLVRPTTGYLSDPDMLVGSDQRLWLFYRAVEGTDNIVRLVRSTDGIVWDSALTLVKVPGHQLVSPSVVRAAPQAAWQMWSINAGAAGCTAPNTTIERRTSTDGINWSSASPVNLSQPGRAVWHIDVQWIPARNEYWALYNTYAVGGSCSTDALYLARSPDGVNWTTYPSPLVRAGVIDAFKHVVYRSTFMTDLRATRVTFWFSGAAYTNGSGYTWQTGQVSVRVADVLAIISSPPAALQKPTDRSFLPPPEP